MWIGTEAEGPERGQKTIFIELEQVDIPRFKEILGWGIHRIYFGAKESFRLPLNIDEVMDAITVNGHNIKPGIKLLYETNSIENIKSLSKKFRKVCSIILVIRTTDVDVIKMIDKEKNRLIWFELYNKFTTYLNDPIYSLDKEV